MLSIPVRVRRVGREGGEVALYSPNGFLHVCLKKKNYPKQCVVKILFQASVSSAHCPVPPHGLITYLKNKKVLYFVQGKCTGSVTPVGNTKRSYLFYCKRHFSVITYDDISFE